MSDYHEYWDFLKPIPEVDDLPVKTLIRDNPLLEALFNRLSGSSSLYISLHTGVPRWQTNNEADYIGYRRVEVPRTPEYWEVVGDSVSNRQPIVFPTCVDDRDTPTASFFAIGTEPSGRRGEILHWGRLTPSIRLCAGVTVSFARGDLTISYS